MADSFDVCVHLCFCVVRSWNALQDLIRRRVVMGSVVFVVMCNEFMDKSAGAVDKSGDCSH